MARKAFYFDMTACIGCRTCQIACKDKNGLEVGTTFRHVDSYESGDYPLPTLYHYSSSCNHCANPACVAACPTGAMYIDADGTVQHDDALCIGCQTCGAACPYSVPQYVADLEVVHKCDMCRELTDNGEQPACVAACQTRCLQWGDYDELLAAHPDAVADIAILPDSSTTDPSVLITPKAFAVHDAGVKKHY